MLYRFRSPIITTQLKRQLTRLPVLLLCLLSCATFAASQQFKSNNDGSIEIAGLQFQNMRDYVASDYFRQSGNRCGIEQKSKRLGKSYAAEPRSITDCTASITRILAEYEPSVTITIPVWFHVITNTGGDGFVSDAAIEQQMTVLNEDFQAIAGTMGANGINSKLNFVHMGTSRTVNNTWYVDNDEIGYKSALGKAQNKYLNIYTNNPAGLLGYAYFPFGAAGSVFDGVVMLSDSIGGRNNGFSIYDQGRTLVHEIGHYLGLYHTFEPIGACVANTFSSGDLIVDTNAEEVPFTSTNCTAAVSSCGNSDPINNYMNYGADTCMTEFSAQQINRMICSTVNYRPDLISIESKTGTIVPILQLLLDDQAG